MERGSRESAEWHFINIVLKKFRQSGYITLSNPSMAQEYAQRLKALGFEIAVVPSGLGAFGVGMAVCLPEHLPMLRRRLVINLEQCTHRIARIAKSLSFIENEARRNT